MTAPRPRLDIERLRNDFPLISQSTVCYLDSAATTQKPIAVLDAIDRYYRQHNANVHRAAHSLSRASTEAFEAARGTVQRFINAAHSDEIIWTRGTTEGINLVAHSFGQLSIQPGDQIIISTLEHHANIVPWQLLAQRSGAQLKVIPLTETADLDLDAYQALLNERTKLVALCHVSNALGTVNPIQPMIDAAHRVGAKVLIDGAQAVSHLTIDVQQFDCDFYLFSGHKLYGPTGIGVLYGKQQLLRQMPPWQGGGEMIEHVSFDASSYQLPPFRFEAGTPNIAGAIGLAAAIDYLVQFDLNQRQSHEQQLLQYAQQQLKQLPGLRIIGQPQQRIGLIPFVIDGIHNFDLGTLLDQQGIALRCGHHCTMPLHQRLGLDGTARASFGLYNSLDDIDRLVAALAELTGAETVLSLTESAPHPEQPLLTELLALQHWKARYTVLMKAAQQLPLQADLQQQNNLLHGCTSKVWLDHAYHSDCNRLEFRIDSDTRIIKGLGILLCELLNDLTAEQILDLRIDPVFQQLGLDKHLSSSRSNGVRAIVDQIRTIAARYRQPN